MDDSLRHFMEECDALQVCTPSSVLGTAVDLSKGIQIMNDTSSFGAFVDSMLTLLRDDNPKLACLTLPFLSPVVAREIPDDVSLIGSNESLKLSAHRLYLL